MFRGIKNSLPILCLFVLLLSSTVLIMRDGEGKVLTAGNMFYNMLSARQALRRHRRWSRHQSSTSTLMPSLPRLLRRRRHPNIVSETDLLPLPVTNLHCIDMHRRCQAGRSTTMLNALRGMDLLATVLCDREVNQIGILRKVQKNPDPQVGLMFWSNYFYM